MVLTCKVSDALGARLAAAARAEHRSKSEIVRESLEARLNAGKADIPESVRLYDRIKHLSGSLQSLPSDILTNPDHMRDFGK